MNREQFEKESEQISLVAQSSGIERQMAKVQQLMEEQAGHLNHRYPLAHEQMKNVFNDSNYQNAIQRNMARSNSTLGMQSKPISQFNGVFGGIFK